MIRNAALKYLLDSGVQWGAAPAVKVPGICKYQKISLIFCPPLHLSLSNFYLIQGIRDATIELLHILVAVHAEVYTSLFLASKKIYVS